MFISWQRPTSATWIQFESYCWSFTYTKQSEWCGHCDVHIMQSCCATYSTNTTAAHALGDSSQQSVLTWDCPAIGVEEEEEQEEEEQEEEAGAAGEGRTYLYAQCPQWLAAAVALPSSVPVCRAFSYQSEGRYYLQDLWQSEDGTYSGTLTFLFNWATSTFILLCLSQNTFHSSSLNP